MIRSRNFTAPATSMVGCTIAELADEIGLEHDEFREWLTFTNDNVTLADGTQTHKDNIGVDTLLGANSFQIPNTIYMAWFGEGWGLGKTVMNWYINCDDMAQLGFHVEVFDNDSYAKGFDAQFVFLEQINNLSSSKYLHGMYMMGHGGPNAIGSEGWLPTQELTVLGPIWSVPYANVPADNGKRPIGNGSNTIGGQIKYHLGAVIIQACDSDGAAPRSLVSTNGIFEGQPGTYVPIPATSAVDPIAKHWGFEYEYLAWMITDLNKNFGLKFSTRRA